VFFQKILGIEIVRIQSHPDFHGIISLSHHSHYFFMFLVMLDSGNHLNSKILNLLMVLTYLKF
jgi:hypothetical protein